MELTQFYAYDLVILVGCLAVPVNVYAFRILHKYPKIMGGITCVFHKALAITDLMTGFSCISFCTRIIVKDSPFVVMVITMVTTSFTLSSVLLLGTICLDRFVAIRHPLLHFVFFTRRKARIYAASVIMASCVLMAMHTALAFDGGANYKLKEVATGGATDSRRQIMYIVTAILFLLTVTSVTALNIALLITLLRYSRRQSILRSQRVLHAVTPTTKTSVRVAKTVLVMTAVFYIVFIPAIACMGLICYGLEINVLIIHLSFVLMQLHCVLNPFIYLIMNPAFRKIALTTPC